MAKGTEFYIFAGVDPQTGKEIKFIGAVSNRKIAQQEATLAEAEIIKGHSHYQTERILMADYLNQWITKLKVNVKEGSMIIYRYNLKKYIIPKIGDIRLAKYTLKEHQEFISSLFNDSLSLNTVKLINGTLHNALKSRCNWLHYQNPYRWCPSSVRMLKTIPKTSLLDKRSSWIFYRSS